MRQGTGCPLCARQRTAVALALSGQDFRELATRRGFEWIGETVVRARKPTRWRCPHGHVWSARYDNLRRGDGCPVCAGVKPRSPADYHALAAERGFRWLGPDVPSVLQPTGWACSTGHSWRTCFSKIQQGRGCPTCAHMENGARVSAPQRRLAQLLDGELNYRDGRYRIDVALVSETCRVAVEYDSWWWHAGRDQADEAREQVLLARGWRVLRIRSNTLLPPSEQLQEALDQLRGGAPRIVLTLPDWGIGPHRRSI
jgi:hypothetical protein